MNLPSRALSQSVFLTTIPAGSALKVISVHRRVVNCLTDAGEWVAIVHPQVGNGPFHIVLERPVSFAHILVGQRGAWRNAGVQIGDWVVDLSEAEVWQPLLAPLRERVSTTSWRALRRYAASLMTDLAHAGWERPLSVRLHRGETTLISGILSVRSLEIEKGVALLAGAGPGLTPAGDDFLLGVMARLWLSPPENTDIPRVTAMISRAANDRTTRLSRVWLQHAASGRFAESWHHLHRAMATNDVAAMTASVSEIFAIGATSGQQAMKGFLALPDTESA